MLVNPTGRRKFPEAERLRPPFVPVSFKNVHGLGIRTQEAKESFEARTIVLAFLMNPKVHQVEQGFLRQLEVAHLRKE